MKSQFMIIKKQFVYTKKKSLKYLKYINENMAVTIAFMPISIFVVASQITSFI